jgi:hypothetical protein
MSSRFFFKRTSLPHSFFRMATAAPADNAPGEPGGISMRVHTWSMSFSSPRLCFSVRKGDAVETEGVAISRVHRLAGRQSAIAGPFFSIPERLKHNRSLTQYSPGDNPD